MKLIVAALILSTSLNALAGGTFSLSRTQSVKAELNVTPEGACQTLQEELEKAAMESCQQYLKTCTIVNSSSQVLSSKIVGIFSKKIKAQCSAEVTVQGE